MKGLRMSETEYDEYQRTQAGFVEVKPKETKPERAARRQLALAKSLSKYRNVKTDGYSSRKEADYALKLKLRQEAGEITDLVEQPEYLLIPAIKENGRTVQRATHYRADFEFKDRLTGERHVVDVKGFPTPVYLLKRKLMRFVHGITVEEV